MARIPENIQIDRRHKELIEFMEFPKFIGIPV